MPHPAESLPAREIAAQMGLGSELPDLDTAIAGLARGPLGWAISSERRPSSAATDVVGALVNTARTVGTEPDRVSDETKQHLAVVAGHLLGAIFHGQEVTITVRDRS